MTIMGTNAQKNLLSAPAEEPASVASIPSSPKITPPITWRRIKLSLKRSFAITATLSTILFTSLIAGLLIEATFRRNSLDLDAIGVPKKLAEDGFSSEVVTQQLRDAIRDIYQRAETSMAGADAEGHLALTGINIPGAGISLADMTASLRRLLPESWKNEVSGEFTILNDQLSLRLRHNGKIIFDEIFVGSSAVATLINRAAINLIRKVQPFMVARALFKDGKIEEASVEANIIILSLPPEDENVRRVWFLKGAIAEENQMYEEAVALYKNAPYPAVVHSNIGFVRFKQGDMATAEREYRISIQFDANYPLVYNNLGVLFLSQGKLSKAEESLRKAIGLNSNLALPYYNLGLLYFAQGKEDDAETGFRKAVSLDKNLSMAHYYVGIILHNRKKFDESEISYRKAIKLDPSLGLARNDLAILLQEKGNIDEAEKEYRTLVSLNPKFAIGHYNLAKLLQDKGMLDEAEIEYRKSYELDTTFALAHYNLSVLLLAKGQADKAEIEYSKAVVIDPKLAKK